MTAKHKERPVPAVLGGPVGLRHGIYGFLATGKLPSGRAWVRAQREIGQLRQALIAQYGGPERIQPSIAVLLDSTIEALTIQRLATMYLKRAGILRQDSLKRGDLELHSILSKSYGTYAGIIRRNLEAVALLAKGPSNRDGVDIDALIAEFSVVKDEAAAVDAPKAEGAQGDGVGGKDVQG